VSGVYSTDYGDDIILRQQGSKITGCYKNGVAELQGVAMGRLLRLSFLEPDVPSAGAATLVVANDKVYGFWYRRNNQMGSPWHATKTAELTPATAKPCTIPIL